MNDLFVRWLCFFLGGPAVAGMVWALWMLAMMAPAWLVVWAFVSLVCATTPDGVEPR